MDATKRLLQELTSKARIGWERNGYEDGLAGRDDRSGGFTNISTRDTYMVGWRDGDQVRRMQETA